jgi:SNF2 family DNA or RNA helicase
MLADLSVDGTRIVCTTEWRHKEMIKTVPGAKWDRDSMVWVTPLTWSSCLALRATFGTELEIGPGLNAWAADYRARVHDPAMALRDALEADGDPDLFPHQRADVQFLATTRRAILASQVGTGKTGAAIRTLVELTRRGENVFPVLVVAPNSVKLAWSREFEKWWPGVSVQVINGTAAQRRKQFATKAHVYVMNYESLRSHSRLAPYGSVALRRCIECGGEDARTTTARCQVHERELNRIPFRTVIADEAHRIKDPTAQQTRALKAAAKGAEFRYAMTGTPIANDVVDLWSILNFVDPAEWPSKTRWLDRLVDITYNVFGGIVVSGVKPQRVAEFEATVYPRLRRMTKEVVLPFLPPVMEERRDVAMSPKQHKAYDDLVTKMLTVLDSGDMLAVTNTLTMSLRLLQLASSYGEIEVDTRTTEDGSEEEYEKFLLAAPSSKIDAFMDDLDDFKGSNVIVFAVSRQLIMLLSAQLEKKGIKHGLIVGGQHALDRQQSIDDFQAGRTNFILVTVAAGGTGITLTAADTAVYLQRSWSMLDMEQAAGRYHRIGSERHVSISRIDYVTPGTIEEAVIAALAGKVAGLEDIVKDRELLKKAMRGDV